MATSPETTRTLFFDLLGDLEDLRVHVDANVLPYYRDLRAEQARRISARNAMRRMLSYRSGAAWVDVIGPLRTELEHTASEVEAVGTFRPHSALAKPCPTCRAPRDTRCVTVTGRFTRPHVSRLALVR